MLRRSVWIILLLSLSIACEPSVTATMPSANHTASTSVVERTPPSSAIFTPLSPSPTYSTPSPIQGSVQLEDGRCCVGGPAGEPVNITARFEAVSPFAEVTQMRTMEHCRTVDEMAAANWEPFTATKVFQFTPPVFNWFSFVISVQFRDAQGNLSAVYCDEIGVEGMPVTRPP